MGAFSNPIVLSGSNAAIMLERIRLSANDEISFSERWLQDALFANPGCLPVREIDPHIGDLIPVCTEIETGQGPADILFVTRTGQIVLVETKLWRNPEARREVVAQILDYAKQLTTWSYEDLARESARAAKQGPGHLMNCLKSHGVDEATFVDGINRSLRTGDFLLLIVGDGIRSGAESLVGFIERYGNLRFGLGLIEVAAYKLPSDGLLLQPRILAKTEILQRTILIGSTSTITLEEIASKDDSEIQKYTDASWLQEFWGEYLKNLQLDDPLQLLPIKPSKTTNLYLGMPPGGGIAWISAYLAQSVGDAGVYLTFLKGFPKLDSYYDQLLADKEEIERDFGGQLTWERKGDKVYISAPSISFKDLKMPEDRQRVISYLREMTNNMVNVFRHRLDTLTHQFAQ
jgi:hypothetical protein